MASNKFRAMQASLSSDSDQELFSYFNGFYTGECGLRSAMGSALERAAFKLGPGQSADHEGLADFVRLSGQGPGSYIEGGRVARALAVLSGPAPLVALTEYEQKKLPKEEQKRRLALRRRITAEWPWYFDVLRAYYVRREPGAREGLVKPYGDFSGVVAVVPLGVAYIAEWRAERRDAEIAEHELAKTASSEGAELRVRAHEEELLRVDLVKPPGWRLVAHRLRRQIAAARGRAAAADGAEGIRRKWDAPTEQHAVAALRALARRAEASKDTDDRAEARRIQYQVRAEAESLWRSAREAYARAKQANDREVRHVLEKRREARQRSDDDEYQPRLALVPADQD